MHNEVPDTWRRFGRLIIANGKRPGSSAFLG
jgi:hypothetical protein